MLHIYEKSFIKLLQILNERVKDPSCRNIFEDMKNKDNTSESKFTDNIK